jgi:Ca2+-binding RTX toxin-like protein
VTIPAFGSPFTLPNTATYGPRAVHWSELANGGFAAAWLDSVTGDISVRAFNGSGVPVGLETILASDTIPYPWSLDIESLSDGRFVVAFADNSLNGGDIRAQVFSLDGQPFGSTFTGNPYSMTGTQDSPAIAALPNGNFVIGYRNAGDINFYRFAPDGTVLNGQGQANYVNSTPDVTPAVAVLESGEQFWVYSAVNGPLKGTTVSLNTYLWTSTEFTISDASSLPNSSFAPQATTLANGSVAVVWLASNDEMYGRVMNANGTPASNVFLISNSVFESTGLTALPEGGFIVGYEFYPGNGGWIRQYDDAGIPVDGPQLLPSTSYFDPVLTTLADGRVLVAYRDATLGNSDVYGQIYDPRLTGLNRSASAFDDDWHGTGFADTVYMGLGSDQFHGWAGNDFVYGEAGNDTLFGGDGADYIKGGNGNDKIWGADGLGALTDTGDVWLAGEIGNDEIHGEGGDDRIDGGDGADTLYGDAGLDYVTAGNGHDTIYGGDETGAGDRWLGGDAGNDVIYGGDGNDRLSGDAGADTLFGGLGNDYATGGADNDFIIGGDETVGGDAYLAGDAGIDTVYGGDGNDRIDGGTEGDFLYGGNGQDTITGAAGDDYIEGGAATDGLYGGAGLDTFDYNSGCGTDNIYDFADDVDTIQIDPSFGLSVAQVLAATSIFGNHAYINLGGGNGMIVLNWISTGHVISQLGDDILIA